jgi:hypothetical protein
MDTESSSILTIIFALKFLYVIFFHPPVQGCTG